VVKPQEFSFGSTTNKTVNLLFFNDHDGPPMYKTFPPAGFDPVNAGPANASRHYKKSDRTGGQDLKYVALIHILMQKGRLGNGERIVKSNLPVSNNCLMRYGMMWVFNSGSPVNEMLNPGQSFQEAIF
jgi:hypothetical protein